MVAAALGCAAVAGLSSPARADTLPVDPQASGSIAFCGPTGQPVTSGLVSTAPFVWTAISTVPAPAAYSKNSGRNATLYIYQERPGVGPGDWSGDQLTGSTQYAHVAHPTAQSTLKDISLAQVVAAYPPQGAGYYELRMKYALLGYGDDPGAYAATTIQVTGTSWHVVAGGSVACSKGGGISSEVQAGVAPAAPSAAYIAAVSAASRAATSSSASAGTQAGGSSSTAGSSGPSSTEAPGTTTTASSSTARSGDSHTGLIITVAVVGALVVAGGGYGLGRRRR